MGVRKRVYLFAALLLILAIMVGCASNNEKATSTGKEEAQDTVVPSETPAKVEETFKPDISKEVKLRMLLLGDKPQDFDLVYAEINKKLKEDINATVEVEFVGWSDIATKIPLILSSGDDVDLIPTGNWMGYFKNARSGAYKELTMDDLKKYAPRTLADSPQKVLDNGMVDGKLYALPRNFTEITINGYVVRGDLMTKYNIPDIKTIDDFGHYLEVVKQNEKDIIPFNTNNNNNFINEELFRNSDLYKPTVLQLALNINDNKPQLSSTLHTPAALELYSKMKEWHDKGYWTKGALNNKITAGNAFKSGTSAAAFDNMTNANSICQSLINTHPEWDCRFYPANPDKPYLANPYINGGMSINTNSKNPDRALMMLDLFRNDQEYNHLTLYGIKGKHFDISADNKVIALEESSKFPPGSAYPYSWVDDRFFLSPDNGLSNYDDVLNHAKNNVKQTNIRDFVPDENEFKSNSAALSDVKTQYELPLHFGIVKDSVEQDLATLREKMNEAGIDKVRQDIQKQLDTFEVIIE